MCGTATISDITPYITMVGGAILGASCAYFYGVKLTQRNHRNTIDLMQRQEFNRAAITFRSRLHSILEGYYPTIHSYDGSDYTKVKETTPRIENIASDFSFSLQGSAISDFNAAVQEYCQYCKAISKEHDRARVMFDHPSSPKPEKEIEPFTTENLSKHVNNLLSFAKEK